MYTVQTIHGIYRSSKYSRKKSNRSRHFISWWLLSERQNWMYHQLGQKNLLFVETVYFAETLLFDLTHGLTLKSRILLLLPFLYLPWMDSRNFFWLADSNFHRTSPLLFLRNHQQSRHFWFEGAFSSSFLLPWLWRLNMTVLLTPLDGKSASKSNLTVW